MTDRRHRKANDLTRDQREERFTTDGKSDEALAAVLAGGSEDHKDTAAKRGSDK